MKPCVYVNHTHHDLDRSGGAMTGISFRVDYTRGQAEVLILEAPGLSEQERLAAFRDELRRLGEALLEAAQSPQAIFWHPPPRR